MVTVGFDYDGTLNESFERHGAVLRFVWPEVERIPQWEEQFRAMKIRGMSTRGILGEFGVPEDGAAAIAARWVAHIEDPEFVRMDRPYDGCLDFLKAVQGFAQGAICSSRQRGDVMRAQVVASGVGDFIEEVFVVEAGSGAGKRKAAVTRGLGISVVVGDTEVDRQWAEELGVRFIPVAWGFRCGEFWREKGLDPAESFAQLLDELRGVNSDSAD
jgi:phosphoglycolate phosphatase-like HAD superfamily hydrolase